MVKVMVMTSMTLMMLIMFMVLNHDQDTGNDDAYTRQR